MTGVGLFKAGVGPAYKAIVESEVANFSTDYLLAFFISLTYSESSFNPNAITHVSKEVRALGLCQILNTEMQEYHLKNAFDPYHNTQAGILQVKMWLSLIDRKLKQEAYRKELGYRDLKKWQALFWVALLYNGGSSYLSEGTFNKLLSGKRSSAKYSRTDNPPAYAAKLLHLYAPVSGDQLRPPPSMKRNRWRNILTAMRLSVTPVWDSAKIDISKIKKESLENYAARK